MKQPGERFHLRLPATSANLGPAFDTAAVALNLHLEIAARAADEFSVSAQGRDAAACGRLDGNLIVETYRALLAGRGTPVVPLCLEVRNEIPLGMGCGSSAAARLAGIALAVQFGDLDWRQEEILAGATLLEGHPDNVTACWLGSMTVSAIWSQEDALRKAVIPPRVQVARFPIPEKWRAVILLPREPVRTEASRELLPSHYSRADVVENLQRCAILVAAFAAGDDRLLQAGMHDRVHQPYRNVICPLLNEMPALRAIPGVLGAALSGAGPGMLLIVERNLDRGTLQHALQQKLAEPAHVEVLQCGFARIGPGAGLERSEA